MYFIQFLLKTDLESISYCCHGPSKTRQPWPFVPADFDAHTDTPSLMETFPVVPLPPPAKGPAGLGKSGEWVLPETLFLHSEK